MGGWGSRVHVILTKICFFVQKIKCSKQPKKPNEPKKSSLYGVLNVCGEYGIYGDSRDSHETYDYCESDYFDDSDGFCGSGKSVNLGEVADSESEFPMIVVNLMIVLNLLILNKSANSDKTDDSGANFVILVILMKLKILVNSTILMILVFFLVPVGLMLFW